MFQATESSGTFVNSFQIRTHTKLSGLGEHNYARWHKTACLFSLRSLFVLTRRHKKHRHHVRTISLFVYTRNFSLLHFQELLMIFEVIEWPAVKSPITIFGRGNSSDKRLVTFCCFSKQKFDINCST